ncbi:MAG: hypothetical protein J5I47_05760 [Vicingus serpentipes]|nr:hypothetical protein [Vicingus serpentipes]
MKIDVGTAIIGGVILIICFLPFLLTYKNKRKRDTQILQALNNLILQYKAEVHNYEIKSNFAIGIDDVRGFVFFSRKLKNDLIEEKCIDLIKFKMCKVNKIKSQGNQIDRLVLSFIPINKNESEAELEFFNSDINFQLDGELQLIERWSVFINNQLKTIIR